MRRTAVLTPLVPVAAVLGILLVAGCGSARPAGTDLGSSGTSPAVGRLVLTPQADTETAVDGAAAILPTRSVSYVLDGPLPSLGAHGPVRRLVPHAAGIADVRRWAGALGLAGTPTPVSGGYQVADTQGLLTVSRFGGATEVAYYREGSAASGASGGSAGGTSIGSVGGDTPVMFPGDVVSAVPVPVDKPPATGVSPTSDPPPISDPPPPAPMPVPLPVAEPAPVGVPPAHAAEAIARALLDRVGALAGDQWTAAVSADGAVTATCAAGVRCPSAPAAVSSRTVTFELVLDGIGVTGVDWSVTIGSHGHVDAVTGEWVSPQLSGTYRLSSTMTVFSELQHDRAVFVDPSPAVGFAAPAAAAGSGTLASPAPLPTLQVHITAVTMGIARWDAFDNGSAVVDLVPTYRFHTAGDGDSSAAASDEIELLALDTGVVDFASPTPTSVTPGQPVITPAPEPVSPAIATAASK